MFTKTGLRPREIQSRASTSTSSGKTTNGGGDGGVTSLKPRSRIGEKLRPITATRRHDFHVGGRGVAATALMLRARRKVPTARLGAAATVGKSSSEPGRAVSAVSTRGGAERVVVAWETSPSSTGRKRVGGRDTSSRGRREIYRHGGGSGGGGGGGGRSRSAGRRYEISTTLRARHPIRKRPEWDDSLRDTSQYRLTPEEAMRRKISLVSKHNTLVFGLGSSSTPTEAVTNSSSVTAAGEAARRRSAKRVEQHQHQQRQQQSCKTRTGFAAAAICSSVSAIYGGGGGGRIGSNVVLEPASATEDDLVAAVSKLGGDPADACGINDATVTLYAKRSGGDDANTCERRYDDDGSRSDGSGGSSSNGEGRGGEDEVELSLPGGGGGGGNGGEVSGSPGLDGIEGGIEAFSKRVGRLDTYRKAGLAEEKRTLGGRGGRASKAEDQRHDRADCCSSQPGDVSLLCLTAGHEGVASGELLCQRQQCHATANDDDSGNHLPAVTGHDAREVDHCHHHGYHSRVNPWGYSAPSPSSSCREQQRLLRKAAARSPSTSNSDGGRDEEVGLVKRIQLLEAQVLQLGAVHPPPAATTTAAATENADGKQKAFSHQTGVGNAAGTREEQAIVGGVVVVRGQPGSAAREEQMRAVIADLLSLSAVLLERATEAERRLRDPVDYGRLDSKHVGGNTGDDTGDVNERVRLVRDSAEAVVVALAGDDNNNVVPPTAKQGVVLVAAPAAATATATATATVATSTAGASSLPEEVAALPSGRSPRRVTPPPHRSTTPCSATKDCWGEALDAVGRLVDSKRLGVDRDEDEGVAVSAGTETPTKSSSPPSPPRSLSSLGLLPPLPTAVAAAMPSSISYHAKTSKHVGSLAGQLMMPLQPPPQSAAGGAARVRLWGPAPQDDDTALLVPVPLDTAGNTPTPKEVEGAEEEEEEEDARASPVSSAPTPSSKPRHPFGGKRTGPRWLRQQVGQAGGGESVSGSGPWGEFSPAFTAAADDGRDGSSGSAREQGGGSYGDDEIDKASRPPIGQWYTPPAYPGVRE